MRIAALFAASVLVFGCGSDGGGSGGPPVGGGQDPGQGEANPPNLQPGTEEPGGDETPGGERETGGGPVIVAHPADCPAENPVWTEHGCYETCDRSKKNCLLYNEMPSQLDPNGKVKRCGIGQIQINDVCERARFEYGLAQSGHEMMTLRGRDSGTVVYQVTTRDAGVFDIDAAPLIEVDRAGWGSPSLRYRWPYESKWDLPVFTPKSFYGTTGFLVNVGDFLDIHSGFDDVPDNGLEASSYVIDFYGFEVEPKLMRDRNVWREI